MRTADVCYNIFVFKMMIKYCGTVLGSDVQEQLLCPVISLDHKQLWSQIHVLEMILKFIGQHTVASYPNNKLNKDAFILFIFLLFCPLVLKKHA